MNTSPEALKLLLGTQYMPKQCPGLFQALEAEFGWEQRHISMYGKKSPIPRLTAWAGLKDYTYSGIMNAAKAWGPTVEGLRTRWNFSGVLANLYRDGKDCVSWHADDEEGQGDIVSLSAGATRKFSMRHNETGETIDYMLSDGDVFVMSRAIQREWQHCIRRTMKDVGPRINLTFRF